MPAGDPPCLQQRGGQQAGTPSRWSRQATSPRGRGPGCERTRPRSPANPPPPGLGLAVRLCLDGHLGRRRRGPPRAWV